MFSARQILNMVCLWSEEAIG